MTSILRPAIVLFLLLSLVTGIVYPLAITGIAQLVFPAQANGSLLERDGKAIGSALLGQDFSTGAKAAQYFWGRLSATSPVPCTAFDASNATGSTGSNLAPTNPALVDNAKARIAALQAAEAAVGYKGPSDRKVPVDLVTSSGSGLDPHISPAAAEYQVARVALARHLDAAKMRELVQRHTVGRQLGTFGEPGVNVLELNLDLDAASR